MGYSRARELLACPLLSTPSQQLAISMGRATMAWVLIRTFIITPVLFLIAAPILLAFGLYAAFESPSGR